MKGFFEICILIGLSISFFVYEIYATTWFWVLFIIVVIVMMSEFIRHFTFQLLAVIFGALYLPANMLLMHLTKLIAPLKKEDKIVYMIFRLLFFPIQVLVIIFSIPYEWLLEHAH